MSQNNLNSKQIFEGRSAYQYPNTGNTEEPINLWNIHKDFGKINKNWEPLLVDQRMLKNIDNIKCLPEVWEAAKKLQENLRLLTKVGKTCVSTIFGDFIYKKGYINFEKNVIANNNIIKSAFFKYLFDKNVDNFKTFLELFQIFSISFSKTISITPLSLFLRDATPYHNGFSLDFDILPHDNDFIKETKFFENPAYDDYTRICGEHGFYVNKNAPWNIIINPKSEQFRKFSDGALSENFLQDTLEIFFNYFLNFIKGMFYEFFLIKKTYETGEIQGLIHLTKPINTDTSIISDYEICLLYTELFFTESNIEINDNNYFIYNSKNTRELLKESYKLARNSH